MSLEERIKILHVIVLGLLTWALFYLNAFQGLAPIKGHISIEYLEFNGSSFTLLLNPQAYYTIKVYGEIQDIEGISEEEIMQISSRKELIITGLHNIKRPLRITTKGESRIILEGKNYFMSVDMPIIILCTIHVIASLTFLRYTSMIRLLASWALIPIMIQGRTMILDPNTRIIFLSDFNPTKLSLFLFLVNSSSFIFLCTSLTLLIYSTRSIWIGKYRYLAYLLGILIVAIEDYQSNVVLTGSFNPCLEYLHTYLELGGITIGILLGISYGLRPKGSIIRVLILPIIMLILAAISEAFMIRILP